VQNKIRKAKQGFILQSVFPSVGGDSFPRIFVVFIVLISSYGDSLMKRLLRSKLVLTLAALVLIAGIIIIPLSGPLVQSHAASAPPPKTLVGHVPDVVKKGLATFLGHHAGMESISLAVGLYLRNKQTLDQFLNDVSNPTSSHYGQYMTLTQANQAFNPTPQQEQQVIAWLKDYGLNVTGTYPNHLLVDAHGTFAQVEKMLHLTLNDYRTTLQSKPVTFYAPANEPTIDGSVSNIVESIVGLDNYPQISLVGNGKADNSPPYYPQDFANAYDINPLWNAGYKGTGEHIGITLWAIPPSDVTLGKFKTKTGANVATRTNKHLVIIPINIKGGKTAPDTNGEAAADIESSSGMAPGAIIDYYQAPVDSSGNPIDIGLEKALNQAGTDTKNNREITNSWASGCEAISAFLNATENILASNTATGHDYFFASGDTGSTCGGQSNLPNYPQASAYVTSVGGTLFKGNIQGKYPGEVACTNCGGGPSGGGYSTIFSRPAWQTANNLAENGKRGYPDIAADGDAASGAYVCSDSLCGTFSGTSLASPLWAGMMADVDQYLQANHLASLGFINPALYWLANNSQKYAPFHDIISGNNGGYNAGPGWDAVTGWGSPNLYNLARDLVGSRTFKTLVVNTTADTSLPCSNTAYSLRCAIMQANSSSGSNTTVYISFHIPSTDPGCPLTSVQGHSVYVCTITPTSSLPQLTASNTYIDGYSQIGAQINTSPLGGSDNAILTIRIDGSKGVGGLVLTGNASGDTIQGLEITNFNSYGILLFPNTVTNNTIAGNYVGTDGVNALGNGAGIYVASGASYNEIGGTTPASINLISGNAGQGVAIGAGGSNTVEGNYIGTDTSGSAALRGKKGVPVSSPLTTNSIPNNTGILIFAGASGTTIGGILSSSANIIAHNVDGILTDGSSSTSIIGNTISSNTIGVQVQNGETGDSIAENTIANNSTDGILVGNSSTDNVHVAININMIFNNGGLGIDLYPEGTVDCATSTSGGPNDYLNCPIITLATPGQVSGTACAGCSVEVYVATNEADDQGHGEGKTFLGSAAADSNGNWSISVSLGSGTQVTATATTNALAGVNETSEFAANVAVSSSVTVNNIQSAFFNNPNDSGSFDVSPSTTPVFTQSFSALNFNPSPSIQNCSNSTGVDNNTRPFTEIIHNNDGSCTTVIAQGNGQQAGVNNLNSFETEYTGAFTVSSAGQLSFDVIADDGWILSIGPNSNGNQPTYVSGPLNNAPSNGPFTGYPVLGANNVASSPVEYTVVVNISAAGTYPLEVDYTECCGGQLTFTMTGSFTASSQAQSSVTATTALLVWRPASLVIPG
jgi:kumamolisin